MSNLITFNYQASAGRVAAVRCVEIDGQPWFVAADVCKALRFPHVGKGVFQYLGRLSGDEKQTHNLDMGSKKFTIISESGLYKLIMRSDKPEARKFQDWVTREVLPAIRKTGRYEMHQADAGPCAGTENTASTDTHAEAIAQTLARHLEHMQRHVITPLVQLVADLVHKVDAPGNVRSVGISGSPVGQETKQVIVNDCFPHADDKDPVYTAAMVKQMVRLVGSTSDVGRALHIDPSKTGRIRPTPCPAGRRIGPQAGT